MGEWQPIKTAPKNGDQILLWSEMWADTYGMVIGVWRGKRDGWCCAEFITGDWDKEDQPTHWMPLPDPPISSAYQDVER